MLFCLLLAVSIHEWDVPTRDARPHDPAAAPDGALWFTEQKADKLGRLDPKTGRIEEFPLPKGSGPHGLVFCGFGSNKLASIDPGSLAIREHELPKGARPRRLALAQDGSVYYSDYARGFLGHFDPTAGKLLEEWPSPGGPGSKPYGIA